MQLYSIWINFPGLVTDNHDKLTGRKIKNLATCSKARCFKYYKIPFCQQVKWTLQTYVLLHYGTRQQLRGGTQLVQLNIWNLPGWSGRKSLAIYGFPYRYTTNRKQLSFHYLEMNRFIYIFPPPSLLFLQTFQLACMDQSHWSLSFPWWWLVSWVTKELLV